MIDEAKRRTPDNVNCALAAALRPGGVLAAVALPRVDLRRELPVEMVAKDPVHESMPKVMDPSLTTREVARQAAAVLPGVRVRRLLFWRYFLIWQKPT